MTSDSIIMKSKDTDLSIWVLSDGKAGDLNQCLGVAEQLGRHVETRKVAPGRPWVWLMPWGPIPMGDRPSRPTSPLHGPFPDVAIASGRRTVAYLRHLKRISPQTVTVFLKDPRIANSGADLIWVPLHDKRRGDTVMATLTGPHRITEQALNLARAAAPASLLRLSTPRISLILGGDTAGHTFGKSAARRLSHYLGEELPHYMSVMVTPSRRTPDYLLNAVRNGLRSRPHWIWDGKGNNPYIHMLALADAIIVTGDSHSMVSDALATRVPVAIFEPDAYPAKLKATIDQLVQQPFVNRLVGPLETGSRTPINSTELIADEIRQLLATR